MNNKTILIFILTIFCIGMTMGSVTASHTYYVGDYSFKVSDTQYKQIQNAKAHGGKINPFTVKTGDTKTYKVPKYKTKKVAKWKYKKVPTYAFKPYTYNTVKLNDLTKYYKNGWKKHSQGYANYKNQKKYLGYNYVVLKKKVHITKKVKIGTKKLTLPVQVDVGWYKQGKKTIVYAETYTQSKGMVYHYSDGSESVLYEKLGFARL